MQNMLDSLEINAIYISDPYNMRYISGFTGGEGALFITKEEKFLFTDFRYTIQASLEAKDFKIIDINEKFNVIQKSNCKKLGFENNSISYNDFQILRKKLSDSNITFMELNGNIDNLRNIKNDDELKYIQRAEEIGDIAFSKILDIIKPGVTEKEIAAYIEFYMKINGATKTSFDTIVASGINSSMPHAVVTDKKIENGDFITMDFGCVYNGYCSDMTRTIVVGKASDEQKKVYNTVLKAQLAAIDNIKEGVSGIFVDSIARNIIDDAGYKGTFGHSLGHGVGLYIHELPVMSPNKDYTLQKGNVVSVEPGIYIENFGGVRIEDLVCVTENGYINFTKSNKKLIEL